MTENALHNDDGLTLVELVVYIVLAAIFLAIVSAVFINGWLAQASAAGRDAATSEANVMTNSLQQSIRNAAAVSPASGTTNTLIAVVATSGSSWECRRWALSGGNVIYTRWTPPPTAPAGTGSPLLAGPTGKAFSVTGTLTGNSMFSINSAVVSYGFSVAVDKAKVSVSGSVVAQATGDGVPTCW